MITAGLIGLEANAIKALIQGKTNLKTRAGTGPSPIARKLRRHPRHQPNIKTGISLDYPQTYLADKL